MKHLSSSNNPLTNMIQQWYEEQIKNNSSVPDFWDECDISFRLAAFLIGMGWKNDKTTPPKEHGE